MKKKAPHSKSSTSYKCRKCLRDDFKKSLEFTNHLARCKGPVTPVTMDAAISKMAAVHESTLKKIDAARPPIQKTDLVSMLREVSNKAGDLKAAVDQVIKRLS